MFLKKDEGVKHMAKIITIANQKGGVGKTTTALCLGAVLESKGYKVLYIDLDKQSNTSKVLRADTTKEGTYSLLAKTRTAKELIQVTANNQYVISANETLDQLDTMLANKVGKEFRLKESLEEIKEYFDFIILDTAPHLDVITINALTCTDYLTIVCNADIFSLDGVKDLQSIINSIKEYTNPNLKVGGILINRFSPRAVLNRDLKTALEQLASEYDTKVYKTFIRECIAVKESQALKQRITDYAPKSNAVEDYKAVADEILKEI